MSNTLFEELQQRGFINQSSDMDAVRNLLDNGKIVAYLGSDPTGDSLHVGHLVPVMMMRWLVVQQDVLGTRLDVILVVQ